MQEGHTTMNRHPIPPRLAQGALAVATLVLGGCSTAVMQSAPMDDTKLVNGLVYALPKAQVEIKASRKMITADDVAKAKAALDKATAAAKDAKAMNDAAYASVDVLKALHKAALEPGKTELHKQLTILEAQAGLAKKALSASEDAQKRAKEDFDKLDPNLGKMLETATLTVMPPVPDPASNARYVASWSGAMTRDDEFKLTVAGGLLNSADASSTDQSAAILVSLAQGVAAARFGSQPFALSSKRQHVQPKDADVSRCEPYELVRRFDPTSDAEVKQLEQDLEAFGKADLGLDITPKPALRVADTSTSEKPGIFYRPLVAATLTLGSRKSADGKKATACTVPENASNKSETLVAVVPDSRTLALLPVEAGMFTTTTHKLVFKDGTPTEVSVNSPSQLAAIAGLPIAIARAMLSVPGELIKLRFNYDSDAAKSLEEQVKQVNKQIELLKAQRLLEAELKVDAAAASSP
jgi:hypothetical protein